MAQCSQCKAETQLHVNGYRYVRVATTRGRRESTIRRTEVLLIRKMRSANHLPGPKEPTIGFRRDLARCRHPPPPPPYRRQGRQV